METVNPRRVRRLLEEFGHVGYDTRTKGTSRLAYSRNDIAAKKLLLRKLEFLGLHVYADPVGNIIGLTEPLGIARPRILLGSHLDTVHNGGRYDGTLGIVAALEMFHLRREGGLSAEIPLGIVCFACEEAARFGKATIGSRYFTGDLAAGELDDIFEFRSDGTRGRSLAQIARDANTKLLVAPVKGRKCPSPTLAGSRVSLGTMKVAAFLELHIEQGSRLETRRIPVGVVTRIAAPTRIHVCLEGKTGHSGTTPMERRTDLFLLAMDAWKSFHEFCSSQNDEELVWTLIGTSTPSQQWGMIPGRIHMDIEIRSTKAAKKRRCLRYLERMLRSNARRCLAKVATFQTVYDGNPVQTNGELTRTVIRAARRLGIEATRLPSMAGHDAAVMAKKCRTAMIFVPCQGGVSHSPAEAIRIPEVIPGIRAVLEAVKAIAGNP